MKRLYDFTFTLKMSEKAWKQYIEAVEYALEYGAPDPLEEAGWALEDFFAELGVKAKFVAADQSRNEADFNKEFPRALKSRHQGGVMGRATFIQWKNTDVCLDFWCPECDAESHYDGYDAYQYRCPQCGFVYALGDRVSVAPGYEDEPAVSGELVDY